MEETPLLVIGNHNYSSWSLRAWFYLKAIGFEFETERLPLDTQEFRDKIDDRSPSGRVPALIMDEEIIWDSMAICMEIGERHAPPFCWPSHDRLRGLARSICSEMHSGFVALRAQMPMNCRARGRVVERTPELEHDIYRIGHIWRENRARSKGQGPWLFGHFTVADAFFAPVVSRFRTYGVELGEEEEAYMDTVLQHDAMQEWYALAEAESEVIESEELGR